MIDLKQGDCLELMKEMGNKSVDLILCDLPYGVTQNKKDKVINLKLLWLEYKRVIKDRGIIILTTQQPFTTDLINSERKLFRYDLIWNKELISGFLNANRQPLRVHESILIFYKKLGTYNPQFEIGKPLHSKGINYKTNKHINNNYGKFEIKDDKRAGTKQKYPKSILKFKKTHPSCCLHPTEKSLELFEYLIKTYSNKNDLVLDNCMGSGTTGLACKNLNRNFIGIELDEKYFDIAKKRIESCEKQQILRGARQFKLEQNSKRVLQR